MPLRDPRRITDWERWGVSSGSKAQACWIERRPTDQAAGDDIVQCSQLLSALTTRQVLRLVTSS